MKPSDRKIPLRRYLREQGVAEAVAAHPITQRLTGTSDTEKKPRRKLKPTAAARKAKAMRGLVQLDPGSPALAQIRRLVR